MAFMEKSHALRQGLTELHETELATILAEFDAP